METLFETLETSETPFDIRTLIANIDNDWSDILSDLVTPFEKTINEALSSERSTEMFPADAHIFAAFKACSFDKIKVVIIGQDCYHHKGQAMGLAFSVPPDVKYPPSLRNVFKELEREYNVKRVNPDLSDWAHQGVLLINTALTVREGYPGSHIPIWRDFTREIVKSIAIKKQGIVYMLWGDFAISFSQYIATSTNCVLRHSHPSPLSRKPFVGCDHFKKCNAYLTNRGVDNVAWV